jgi:hypothetical protein
MVEQVVQTVMQSLRFRHHNHATLNASHNAKHQSKHKKKKKNNNKLKQQMKRAECTQSYFFHFQKDAVQKVTFSGSALVNEESAPAIPLGSLLKIE